MALTGIPRIEDGSLPKGYVDFSMNISMPPQPLSPLYQQLWR